MSEVCSCSFEKGENCLRCEQNQEYQESLLVDSMCTAWPIEFQGDVNDELTVLLTVQEMRQLRVAHFQADNTHNPSQQVQQSDALHEERVYVHAPPAFMPTDAFANI